MVAEMTGGYALLPALMLVSFVAIVLQRGHSIYTYQVKDRFQSPAHAGDLVMNVLEELRVSDVFRRVPSVVTVSPATSFESIRKLLLSSPDSTITVVASDGTLAGLLTTDHIRPVMDDRQLDRFVVAGDICTSPVSLYVDDDLFRAHQLFHLSGCPQIPVISDTSAAEFRILGMLDYRDLMRAYEAELLRRRAS
jgi:chloride channel protein, CIC family